MAQELLTPDYIFEASWEVCNKVGGIYTVLSTRANTLQNKFRDRLIFGGEKRIPYLRNLITCVLLGESMRWRRRSYRSVWDVGTSLDSLSSFWLTFSPSSR